MLREILRPIKMIWIVFVALRTGIFGAALMVVVAICVAPATSAERDTLALDVDSDARITLFFHRAATFMVKADSDRLYTTIAEGSVEDLSPWQVRFVAELLADGTIQIDGNGEIITKVPGLTPEVQPAARNYVRSFVAPAPEKGLLAQRTNTAKFVTARTN
jgi:hypothetical protein